MKNDTKAALDQLAADRKPVPKKKKVNGNAVIRAVADRDRLLVDKLMAALVAYRGGTAARLAPQVLEAVVDQVVDTLKHAALNEREHQSHAERRERSRTELVAGLDAAQAANRLTITTLREALGAGSDAELGWLLGKAAYAIAFRQGVEATQPRVMRDQDLAQATVTGAWVVRPPR